MADMMPKKNYDTTEITRLLLEMRENCIPKAGNAYEDPNRTEKYDALNAAIDLINNPSIISRWISVKDRLPEPDADGTIPAVFVTDGEFIHMAYCSHNNWFFCENGEMKENMFYFVSHWMPLPEAPREE